MQHLNPKVLAFYGGLILSVTALFGVVTTYGEAKLKAPRRIDGRYPLPTQGLPGCLQSKQLVLQVQQSGKYLTAALLPTDASEKMVRIAEERPSLAGQWHQPQLTLTGTTESLPDCRGTVDIQGKIIQEGVAGSLIYGNNITSGAVVPSQGANSQDTLTGTLRLGSDAKTVPFSAKREAPLSKTQEH